LDPKSGAFRDGKNLRSTAPAGHSKRNGIVRRVEQANDMQDKRNKFNRILGMFCSNGQMGADLDTCRGVPGPAAARNAHAAGLRPARHFVSL